MADCLLHPDHGYYTTREPFGAQGDFTTAPEISQMFGELLGLCLAQYWLDLGAPAPFTLAELGPGRGTLMADVLRAAQSFAAAHKPIGLLCIAPVLAAKIFGPGVFCSIGQDADTAAAIEQMGGVHQACEVSEICEDPARKLVTTPAYMLAHSISEAASGINKLVDRVLELANPH